MATALQLANYWWIALGILAYLVVELAAAVRWQVLLRVQGIRLSNLRVGGTFPDWHVLQSIHARRHGRRYH